MLGFNYEVEKNCALLDYLESTSGNFLPTFREKLLDPSSGFKKGFSTLEYGSNRLSINVRKNYHNSMLNDPEEFNSRNVY